MLTQKEIDEIVKYVKNEPRTVQDIARLIKRSWVTANTYLNKIKELTGEINIKTFRKGSQGALKVVYYNYKESLVTDDVKQELYKEIRNAKKKADFDFFDIYQFIEEGKVAKRKQSYLFEKANDSVLAFSGNLSFVKEKMFEELLKRKIPIKIICRVDFGTLKNISKLNNLLKKYPKLIEIRHANQPLRGAIIDDFAHFRSDIAKNKYAKGELDKDVSVFYEVYDSNWVDWLKKVFWNIYRSSIDYKIRLKELEKI